MTYRWQYPTKAEPVLPESLRPETPQLDKWYQPPSEPVRRSMGVLSAAAIIASGAVFVGEPNDLVLDPQVSPHQEINQPVQVAQKPQPAGAVFVGEPSDLETFNPEEFPHQPANQPVVAPLGYHASLEDGFSYGPHPTIIDPLDPAEFVHIETNQLPIPTPPLPIGARQHFAIDPVILTQPEVTQLDKWYQPASEPVRLTPFNLRRFTSPG